MKPRLFRATLPSISVCAALLAVLSACGGGGGGSTAAAPPSAVTPPPSSTLPRGLSVLAGSPGGYGNADGPVGRLMNPGAIAIDSKGVLYVADYGATVRTVTPGTGAGADMVVGTRWKGPDAPRALAVDASGNLVGIIGNRVVRIAPDGSQTTLAGSDTFGNVDGAGAQAQFASPTALAIDGAGLIWVADGNGIRTVTASGTVGTNSAVTAALRDPVYDQYGHPIGYTSQAATGLAFDNAGNLVIGLSNGFPGATARKVTPAGTRLDTKLGAVTAVAADRNGNVYGFDQCTLYKADASGQVSVLAGSPGRRGPVDGAGSVASFGTSYNCDARIVTDSAGDVFVADTANNVLRKVTPDGVVSTVAGKATMDGLADGTGAAARFNAGAIDLSFDGKDSLYLVQDGKVRKATRAGVVTTLNLPAKDANQNPITYFAGGMAYQGSLVGVANGVVYLVDENGAMRALAGSPTTPHQTDGTGAQAGFDVIRGVAHDGAGNFYLLDSYTLIPPSGGLPYSIQNRIRKLTPSGVVTTLYVAPLDGGTNQPVHIVADRQGNVFASTNNGSVLKVAAAGGTSSIPVDLPYGPLLAVDGSGGLFLANFVMQAAIVEKLGPNGQSQLVAGRRDQFGLITGDLPGSLNQITAMTVDDQGVIYVMTENALVRIVP